MKMKIRNVFLLVLFAFGIVACCAKPVINVGPNSSLGSQPQNIQHLTRAAPGQQEQDIKTYWAQMLIECKPAFSRLESTAVTLKWWSFGIAAVGTIAGAIVVPVLTTASAAANAAWITGFGGVSGAANTAQNTLKEQGLTSEYQLTVREGLRKQWQQALDEYYQADAPNKQILALQKATAACIGYAMQNPDVEVKTEGKKEDTKQ